MTKQLKTYPNKNQLSILINGDLLVILSFVLIGRGSHSLAITDFDAIFSTALPFVIGWILITPWFGIYKQEISQNWRKLIPRLLIAWAVAGPISLALRALFLGRAIPAGIVPMFAITTMLYIAIVALLWRLTYIWWVNRNRQSSRNTNL